MRLLLRFADGPMNAAATSRSVGGGVDATATPVATLRLQLLNSPRLLLATGEAHALERKDAALLAMLAIEGPTPRNRAATLLWPDIDEERARSNLRQRLFRLRRLAAADVVCAGSVLALGPGVQHDLDAIGPRLAADADAAAGELLGALDYGDCRELSAWVDVAREQWRTARCNALAEIAARLEGQGRIAPALRYAQRLAADDPTLEHAHRRVMRLHYLRGDRAAALAAYERCRQTLGEHLGAQPSKETRELARLIEASGALPGSAPFPQPIAVLRPPQLVGRGREWQLLEEACAQLRLAVVSGEPGIGKTRLLSDFAAAHGNAVVAGSRPGDARVPYAFAATLLRALVRRHGAPSDDWVNAELAHLLPELGQARGKLEPMRLQMAATQALAHWHEAGLRLVVIDDLHFADEATLELLPALASGTTAPVGWLFGVRANEVPAALHAWLAQQDAGAVVNVRVAPLVEDAVRELLGTLALPGVDAARLAPALARHTGGNPLFILETLRSLLMQGATRIDETQRLPVPASVGELIERRLARLSQRALKLARVAAIAGLDFSAELAAAIFGQHVLDIADAWLELEAAQIIRDNAFAHDLIREATLKTVPRQIAAVLHREVATRLAAADGVAARIAQHFEAAESWAQAGEYQRRAAAQARRDSRRADEARLLERAVACYERAGMADAMFDCADQQASALVAATSYAAADALAQRLARLAETPRQRLIALDADASNYCDQHNDEIALAKLRAARTLCEELDDAPRSLRLARKEASVLGYLNRNAEALALLDPLIARLDRSGADPSAGETLCDYAALLEFEGRLDEAVAMLGDAERLARASSDLTLLGAVLQVRAVCNHHLARLQAAAADYDAARRLYPRSRGEEAEGNFEEAGLARHWRDLGRFAESIELAEAAIAAARDKGRDWVVAHTQLILALTWVQLGQAARAQRLLSAIRTDMPSNRFGALLHRAELERYQGRPMRPVLEEALKAADQVARRERMRWAAQLRLCAEINADEAVETAERICAEAQARGIWSTALPALAQWADALRRAGRASEAAERAARLVETLQSRSPVALYAPEYRWIAHRAFAAAGDAAAAREALQHALHWIETTALPNVPAEFRDSFLNRNPINRAVVAASRRLS